ncbi:hypothetical protein BGX38DRAFT_1261467 [Terfezia claveryi]|nr:hypothetical protein BGX38DRAFT_1261467 [Terfezia claveryi]
MERLLQKRQTAWPSNGLITSVIRGRPSSDHVISPTKSVAMLPDTNLETMSVPASSSENTPQSDLKNPWTSYKKYIAIKDHNAIVVHHEPSDTIAILSTIQDRENIVDLVKVVHASLASIHEICVNIGELTEPQMASITNKVLGGLAVVTTSTVMLNRRGEVKLANWFMANANMNYPEAIGKLVTAMMIRGFAIPTTAEPILSGDRAWSAQAYNFVNATAYADIETLARHAFLKLESKGESLKPLICCAMNLTKFDATLIKRT